MALYKIISGGQTGTDIAALRTAKRFGYRTGGTAPQGFKTLAGENPELRDLYKLQQADNAEYANRTAQNVKDSDATLRIARNFDTYGEQCTYKWIKHYDRPHYDVWVMYPHEAWLSNEVTEVLKWIRHYDIGTLNIAGSSSPQIEPLVELFLADLFTQERRTRIEIEDE